MIFEELWNNELTTRAVLFIKPPYVKQNWTLSTNKYPRITIVQNSNMQNYTVRTPFI